MAKTKISKIQDSHDYI